MDLIDENLKKKPAFSSKREYANSVGLYSANGLRLPSNATGGELPSMHCYGLAVDLNYKGNPFVGFHTKVDKTAEEVINHATLLITGKEMNVKESPEKDNPKKGTKRKSALEMWDILHKESEALKTYFSLGKDTDELTKRVEALQKAGDKRSVQDWQKLIEEDYAGLTNPTRGKKKITGDFTGHTDPAKGGFMDLDKILVKALTQAGLYWGGQYNTAKDIMHFDWRNGTIKR
jgi:hypothetical protein